MGRSKRKPELWRVRYYVNTIRQIKGKPLLEALHRLQNGTCAYDRQPCALLLPQAIDLSSVNITREQRWRFATVDHVVPRALGGENRFDNLVLASQVANGQKGSLAPLGAWVPAQRHTLREVERALLMVEELRWAQALKFASNKKINKQGVIDTLVRRELRRLASNYDFKFYNESNYMVA